MGDGANATVAGPWWSRAKTNDFIKAEIHTVLSETVMNVLRCGCH